MSRRPAKSRRVTPAEPAEREAIAAQELEADAEQAADGAAELPAAPEPSSPAVSDLAEERGEMAAVMPSAVLRAESEISQDVAACTVAVLGGMRWLFSRGSRERSARFAQLHTDKDPRTASKIGRALASTILRRNAETADAILEWVSVAADLLDEFASSALAENAKEPAPVRSIITGGGAQ